MVVDNTMSESSTGARATLDPRAALESPCEICSKFSFVMRRWRVVGAVKKGTPAAIMKMQDCVEPTFSSKQMTGNVTFGVPNSFLLYVEHAIFLGGGIRIHTFSRGGFTLAIYDMNTSMKLILKNCFPCFWSLKHKMMNWWYWNQVIICS